MSSVKSRIAGMALFVPAILIVAVLFVYPFCLSLLRSFQTEQGWGLQNYLTVWDLYKGDMLYTLEISLASLIILLLFATILGGYLRLKQNNTLEFLFKIPLFIPFVVVGHAMRVFLAPHGTLNVLLAAIGLINLDNPPSIAFSGTGVVFALVWKNLSFALLMMMGAFRSVKDSYIDAAYNIGAKSLKTIFSILVPMSKGAISVAAVLIFTSMMGSFSIPVMLGTANGPQMAMVDLYYQIVYQNNYGVANAIGVISYLISMGAAIYYLKLVTKE